MISWISAFPHESERLFYGKNIVFNINDIIKSKNHKRNTDQLKILNLFQDMTKNQNINWMDKKNITDLMINDIVQLIKCH